MYIPVTILDFLSNKLSLVKEDKKDNNKISVNLISLYRSKNSSDNYLLSDWTKSKLNNRIDMFLERKIQICYGNGNLKLDLKTSTLGSDYNYSLVSLTAINNNKYIKLKINTRGYFQARERFKLANESLLGL